ncbi:TonB-dependent receptor domain-containing protein [Syntrophotalea acetylenica]|jgi:iron complex outermembrane receptor protein|uniref:TonB-dependent receptor n=1 Tax=Syntrophotalea acetylenica TaxID=29542 RepID=UPI002A36B0C5|nr:TonB-dependent receptor [Syntrophotalea acetylenica]MDY0261356.1 TonB-dependent receptor [Syntrophotalea acetylenica]
MCLGRILLLTFWLVAGISGGALAGSAATETAREESGSALSLEAVEVHGKGGHVLFDAKSDKPCTATSLTGEGIESIGGTSQGSPLQAVRTLPSVQTSSEEPYGFGNFFTSGLKIRGQRIKAPGSNLLIEGLQVTGTPGGAQYLFDMENVEGMTLYKGGIPVPNGLAFAANAGLIDYRLQRPADEAGIFFSQSLGSFDYQRSFIRVDSGRLPGGTRAFASYSYTDADKWRGQGGSPDWRHNLDFGIAHDFGDRVKLELFGNFFSFKAHDFRSLTYAQTQDLDSYHKSSYNRHLAGNPGEDIYYYDYNRRRFDGYTLMADVDIRLTDHSRFSVRPYFSKDQGYWMLGVVEQKVNPLVRKWEIGHHRLGVVAQYEVELPLLNLTAGYWYHEQERPGPPTEWKKYTLTGDGLDFSGWSVFSENGKHITHSPFVQLNRGFGKWHLSGGVRYHYQEFSDIESYYFPGGVKTYDPWSSVGRKYTDKFLPFAGCSFELTDHANLYFTYGRNVGRTAFPLYPSYATRRGKFVAAGVSLADLWDDVGMEVSDHYDLGARFDFGRWYLNPVLFYSRHFDKSVDYYDPTSGLLVMQNVASARSYGAEIEAGVHVLPNLLLAANGFYNKFEFDKNIRTSLAGELRVRGNQIADTPLFGASFIADYRLGGFSVTPVVRYTGRRYGDILNQEPLDSYWLADLNMAYRMDNFSCIKEPKLSLKILNLFDKKYIGAMDAADDAHPGSMAYYPGAPFTMVFTVSWRL